MKTKAKTISSFGFMQQFPNERESVAFAEKCLWGDKSICPHCCGKETTPVRCITVITAKSAEKILHAAKALFLIICGCR